MNEVISLEQSCTVAREPRYMEDHEIVVLWFHRDALTMNGVGWKGLSLFGLKACVRDLATILVEATKGAHRRDLDKVKGLVRMAKYMSPLERCNG